METRLEARAPARAQTGSTGRPSLVLGSLVALLRVGTLAWILVAFFLLFLLHFTDHSDLEALIATTSAFLGMSVLGVAYTVFAQKLLLALERGYQGRLYVRNLELQGMAMRDDLTQLFNRRYFYDRLQRELEDADVLGHPLGVVLLDVDDLKVTNDTFGHKVGDEVLAAVGRMLAEHTRDCDVPARIGGDEFAVLMLDLDKRRVARAAKRLHHALEGATVCEVGGTRLNLRISIGAGGCPWAGGEVDEIMRAADAELYAMKAARRRQASEMGSPAPV